MQDLCLLLRSDLQLEADMNPLADTQRPALSVRRGTEKSSLLTRMSSIYEQSARNTYGKSDQKTVQYCWRTYSENV